MTKFAIALLITLSLTACFPTFDWRDVQGEGSPYTVLMPAKPSRLSREIQLGKHTVTMHMTTTQVDDVKFAVGAVKMPNALEAQEAAAFIKNALLKNMAGKVTQQESTIKSQNDQLIFNNEFDAISASKAIDDSPARMSGRIVVKDVWVFQVLVVGPEQEVDQEAADTFLDSFKPT